MRRGMRLDSKSFGRKGRTIDDTMSNVEGVIDGL